jgi:hypothetical protein
MGEEAQLLLGLGQGGHVARHADPRTHFVGPERRPQDVHHCTILADVTVTEIEMGVAVHDADDRGAGRLQVVRVHVAGDWGAGEFVGAVAQQGFAGIADEHDGVVPVDHEHGVQHQVDQLRVERLQVNGHGAGSPLRWARSWPDREGRRRVARSAAGQGQATVRGAGQHTQWRVAVTSSGGRNGRARSSTCR